MHLGNNEFKCDQFNCNKVYKYKHFLREHKKNYLCGYSIIKLENNDICGENNILKYIKTKICNHLIYRCIDNAIIQYQS